jgi:hypothetical protein
VSRSELLEQLARVFEESATRFREQGHLVMAQQRFCDACKRWAELANETEDPDAWSAAERCARGLREVAELMIGFCSSCAEECVEKIRRQQ